MIAVLREEIGNGGRGFSRGERAHSARSLTPILCSPPRRFRGLTVIVCDIVASRKSPAGFGRGKSGEVVVMSVLLGHSRRISVIRRRLSRSQHSPIISTGISPPP
jgi:hypothetical protein